MHKANIMNGQMADQTCEWSPIRVTNTVCGIYVAWHLAVWCIWFPGIAFSANWSPLYRKKQWEQQGTWGWKEIATKSVERCPLPVACWPGLLG